MQVLVLSQDSNDVPKPCQSSKNYRFLVSCPIAQVFCLSTGAALQANSPAQSIASYPSTSSPLRSRLAHEFFECVIARVIVQLVLLYMLVRVINDLDIDKLSQVSDSADCPPTYCFPHGKILPHGSHRASRRLPLLMCLFRAPLQAPNWAGKAYSRSVQCCSSLACRIQILLMHSM